MKKLPSSLPACCVLNAISLRSILAVITYILSISACGQGSYAMNMPWKSETIISEPAAQPAASAALSGKTRKHLVLSTPPGTLR
ncbi:hypothetical protein [Dyadobacter sandarakinus]|uniref:Uncharacterized protein n=1 Tax=Dyadobacter sandarakinus TaxID=2747268 RepID=A0ABX7I477_9BACT|nr:hypothetical protein [Dyadobacter sandarakinus]QRR00538.1 hypothetical protein HWI92_06255 [Dyadobacter sandarakinus]